MWISWTVGSQSIAQISTNKHDSGLVPDSSFFESKARCRMGHETRNRGGNKQWGKLSRNSGIPAKRGAGAKKNYFAICFAEPIFAQGMTPKKTFLRFLFFADDNTLCRELNIFANFRKFSQIFANFGFVRYFLPCPKTLP